MTNTDGGFRPDVEGLRGLAVLLVVLFHAGVAATGGFVGVDVFFVISGYLITGLLLRELEASGRVNLSRFYARRVRRLLPAAALVLLIGLAAVWFLVDPLDRASVELDGAAAALSVANIRFAIGAGDYFAAVSNPSPFLHFWSLGVEEQFYLVWPTLLILGVRVARPRVGPRVGAAVVLGIVFTGSLVAELVVTGLAVNWAFYTLPTRAFELAAGGLVAAAATPLARLPRPAVAVGAVAGLGVILGAALLLDQSIAYPGPYALLPTLATAAIITAGPAAASGRLLAFLPLRWLGRISYSVYLWHWPILVLVPLALGSALDTWQTVACIGATLLVGAASWTLIEEPFRRGLRPMTNRPGRTVLAGMAAVVSVALISGGLAARSTDQIAGYASSPGDTTSSSAAASISALPPAVDWSPPGVALRPLPSPNPTTGPTTAPTPSPVPIDVGPLPRNVRPPLADARTDKEQLWADGCLGFEPSTAPPSGCVFGSRGAKFTIALVGDSHASDLFPAFNWVAKAEGARLLVFVKVACPFIAMPIVDPILKREYTECSSWNAAVIERVASIHPDLTVVAMSHWIYPLRSSDNRSSTIGLAVGRMLARLSGPVVLIVDTPHADVDVPACLSAHITNIAACVTPRRIALSRHDVIERIAATAARVPTLDLARSICPIDPCPAVLNGMIVYRDSHHLTATFAVALGPVLDRGLAPYL